MSGIVLVLWVRHGQNQANVRRQFSYRRVDLQLTQLGQEQAEQLADRLAVRLREAPPPPLGIFASPLQRAQQTADAVASRLGGDVQTVEGLRELNVGELDGRSDPAAWQTYETVLNGWRNSLRDLRFPGGENWHELSARLRASLNEVVLRAHGSTAVVVAHGANVRAALPELTGAADPGTDLATGHWAELEVTPSAEGCRARLLSWPSEAHRN